MKNIHVLPTDKPSRLFEILQFNFVFDNQNMYSEEYKKLHSYKNQNIYITSDEEIKEGVNQWYLDKVLNKPRNSSGSQYGENQNVIILTTDQDLIKYGVQAITDEFLEWFVKNQSCEWVEVEKISLGKVEGTTMSVSKYKIIIPKETPKQGTMSEAIKQVVSNQLKQETLEEAAEKLTNDFPALEVRFNMTNEEIYGWFLEALQKGAKWQEQQMYSEEEVLNFTQTIIQQYKLGNTNIEKLDLLKETLEQFKNK